jgi:hypothetical protein
LRSGSEIRPNADQSDLSQVFAVDDIITFWMDISRIHQAGGGCLIRLQPILARY